MSLHPSSPRPREYAVPRLTPLPLAVTLTLLLAACGGAEAGGADDALPTPTALSGTAAPTPGDADAEESAEPTDGDDEDADDEEEADDEVSGEPDTWATFTEEPGPLPPGDAEEAFGDDPRVQTVLAFNEEFARAATANDPQRAEFVALIDPGGYDALLDYLGEEFGKTYPGPLPFTLLDVVDGEEEGTASVEGCIVSDGFALGQEGFTGQSVTSIEYALVEDPAAEGWLVEAIWAGSYDCSTVTVEARAW